MIDLNHYFSDEQLLKIEQFLRFTCVFSLFIPFVILMVVSIRGIIFSYKIDTCIYLSLLVLSVLSEIGFSYIEKYLVENKGYTIIPSH